MRRRSASPSQRGRMISWRLSARERCSRPRSPPSVASGLVGRAADEYVDGLDDEEQHVDLEADLTDLQLSLVTPKKSKNENVEDSASAVVDGSDAEDEEDGGESDEDGTGDHKCKYLNDCMELAWCTHALGSISAR